MTSTSDEYVRTARQLVTRLQARAAWALKEQDGQELRVSGIEELSAFLHEQGFNQTELDELRERLHLDLSRLSEVEPSNCVSATSALPPALEPADSMPVAGEAEDVKDEAPPPYFIAVVGKRRLRRLHRHGGCGTVPADLRETIALQSLQDAVYDLACKHCWRKGSKPGDPSSDSGSGDDSSSSSSECNEDGLSVSVS